MLARTFLTMWVHELGHAASAWLCGLGAFPGPWRTPVSGARLPLVSVALLTALARSVPRVAGATGLSLSPRSAGVHRVRGRRRQPRARRRPRGDLLRGPGEPAPPRGAALGFVGIAAASVVDAFHTWLRARADPGEIPLGEIEGVGLSDAGKLTSVHGWTNTELTGRYVALGVACPAGIAILYVAGVLRARVATSVAALRRGTVRPTER